jgi:RHS repeat-associated protein
MLANGSNTPFTCSYLPGSDLKSSLVYPNGLTASWTYDSKNQLLQVCNAFPTNVISQYNYTYDATGRRVTCAKSGSAFAQNDTLSYGYNEKSELTNAVASVDSDYRYAYGFDDIGNRETSSEHGTNSVYTANHLNQYVAVDDFVPQFDDDGNQTLVKTATGIWSVAYNGENRPVCWESGNAIVTMSFDRMGRRVTKNDQRFVYDGYLQIADNSGNAYIWDPTEKIATRPLAWRRGASVAYYAHDGNKNVSEVVAENGDVAAHYEYAPFGALTASVGERASVNPWRFSSEYAEDDTATVYYNYRHFNLPEGRWCSRDMIGEGFAVNLMCYVRNRSACKFDFLGNKEQDWPRIGKAEWKRKKDELTLFEYDVSIEGLKEGCEVNFIQLVRRNDGIDGGYWALDISRRGQGNEPDDKPMQSEDMYYYDTFDPRQRVHYHQDGTVTFTDRPGTDGLEFYLFVVQRCCLEYYGGRKSCHCCKHSKATVVKRVHWETTSEPDEKYGSLVKVTKLSKRDEYKSDYLLKKLLKEGGRQINCEAYQRDNPKNPMMRTTIDLEFRYNSHN